MDEQTPIYGYNVMAVGLREIMAHLRCQYRMAQVWQR